MAKPKIGLDDNARAASADALGRVLADTYSLYLKTHAFHWNVTGPQFPALHMLFETQYREMWEALDVIAERVRALGRFAPQNDESFADATAIEPAPNEPPPAAEMVKILLKDHETLVRRAREALDVADEVEDDATEDLLTQRIQSHEKTAWMLRAMTE